MHSVEHGIWREIVKNVKNEKYALQDLEYGDKSGQQKKNEKHTLSDLEYGKKH